MFVFAVPVNAQECDIFVVLEDQNIERMRAADPAEVDIGLMRLTTVCRKVIVCYPSAAETAHVLELGRRSDLVGAMRILMRGWKFRADLGDSSAPYESLK